jgi:hypothetical protein
MVGNSTQANGWRGARDVVIGFDMDRQTLTVLDV